MCYFEQTRWACGYWKWGNFRQQCNSEYRTGETCGLKLVYDTTEQPGQCKICDQIDKKSRRLEKMNQDIRRWLEEGNRRRELAREDASFKDEPRIREVIILDEAARQLEGQIKELRAICEERRSSLHMDTVLRSMGERSLHDGYGSMTLSDCISSIKRRVYGSWAGEKSG
jgi:hypothetical protein